jgi:hypothetical protein
MLMGILSSCQPSTPDDDPNPNPQPENEVDFWLTKADQTIKLEKQATIMAFGTNSNIYPFIEVYDSQVFQTVDGFGYSLTGGSAEVINSLSTPKKNITAARIVWKPKHQYIRKLFTHQSWRFRSQCYAIFL